MNRLLLKLTVTGLIVFILGANIGSVVEKNFEQTSLYCEDGERFFIKERAVVETSNIPQISDDLIMVDTQKMTLTLYRCGQLFKKYPVAIGTSKTPSPIGEWRIIHKGGNWGGGFGLRWLGLNVPWGIYGIHGTNKPGSIGYRSSHGCIRMYNRDILELYSLVKLGTPVHILGILPRVSLRKEYKQKQTGKDVLMIQFALRKAGFDPGPADARFGPGVERAVRRLQYFYGITPSGTINLNEQYLLDLR